MRNTTWVISTSRGLSFASIKSRKHNVLREHAVFFVSSMERHCAIVLLVNRISPDSPRGDAMLDVRIIPSIREPDIRKLMSKIYPPAITNPPQNQFHFFHLHSGEPCYYSYL